MTEIPVAVEDRTRRTPAAPLTAVSIGNVTRVSTSSGAIPWASVMIVTEGAVRSGKTSTGILTATIVPPMRTTAAMARTINRFAKDHPISLAIIVYPSFETANVHGRGLEVGWKASQDGRDRRLSLRRAPRLLDLT